MRDAARALGHFYATLTPASLAQLGYFYAPDARFRDPFNDVVGLPAIERIFRHMFASLAHPRFEVTNCLCDGREAMLGWIFRFGSGRGAREIRGVSHLRFDESGRVVEHIDHWDAARQLYETIPALGTVLRAVRRRLAARD